MIGCLRKGSESEGKLAAIVTSLVLVQLGEPNDELYLKFRDAMLPILRDGTKSSSLRTIVCLFSIQKIILYESVFFCICSTLKRLA